MNTPDKKIKGSLYNSVDFIDSRSDTNDLGRIYSPAYRRLTTVIPKIDFYTQFNWLLYNLIDSGAGKNELLIQVRKFKFSESLVEGKHYGSFTIRLALYLKKDSAYFKLTNLDTCIIMPQSRQCLKTVLFDESSKIITGFISRSILGNDSSREITYRKIIEIDKTEKENLKLFNALVYNSGVYSSYNSFKNQEPDMQLINAKYRLGKIKKLVVVNKRGKIKKMAPNNFYAFVYQKQPYVVTKLGCYPLTKNGGDFTFNGHGRLSSKVDDYSAGDEAYLMSYRPGYNLIKLADPTPKLGLFEFKVDHVDGSFDMIKKLGNSSLAK